MLYSFANLVDPRGSCPSALLVLVLVPLLLLLLLL